MKKYIITMCVILLTCSFNAFNQSLSINTDGSTANASAMLDVKSTVKGLLIPRMTTAQKTAIATPATGLQVYDTDLNQLYFYNGSTWTAIANSTNYWTLSGSTLYNNAGTKVGIGSTSPSAKLHIGNGTRIGILDTGSIFLQSGNAIGSARDWKISVALPNGYLTFRDMGYDNAGTGAMSTDAMVMQWGTGNVGIGTSTPGDKLEINGNLKFTVASTIYSNTGTALSIRPGDGTGSGGALTIRGGNAGVGSGGAGGDLNLVAGANMPIGGAGYGGLGVPGVLNITGSYGYNSVGGAINITAGATSCWSLVSGSHSDVNIKGGTNLAVTDASSIVVEGGYTIGTICPPPGATGGNLILKSGLASGTGTNGNIQLLNGNVGIGTSAPSSKLEVCGNTRIIGTLNVSSTVTSSSGITCPSDFRYKKNITPLTNNLQMLLQLQGVNYLWKQAEFPNMNFNDKKQMGFIAQDVEKIFPEMVFTDDAGYKSIDYSRLTPVLVETIKEQQKQITAITKRLDEIERLISK